MCVGNDDDVRSVALSDGGVMSGVEAGAIVVDHTTVSAELAVELEHASNANNADFLDAPVSGGQAGAENGQLTVMLGGAETVFARAENVIGCYAKSARLMGNVGAGQLTKMVNQVCIAGILQGLSEGLHLAEKAGLDLEDVVDVICPFSAPAWPPLTGASRKSALFALDACSNSTASSADTVVWSTTMAPASTPDMTPPSDNATLRTSSSLPTHINTIPAPIAASRGLLATDPPCSTHHCSALAVVRLYTAN
jgi:hypothetical protein